MRYKNLFFASSIFLATLFLYTITSHPFFSLGDSGEFITVAKTFGVSHPPGASLYTIFSYVFAWLPIATLIQRLNFLSAFFGAFSACLVFVLLQRITKNVVASISGAFWFVSAGLFWSFATTTEVYTMATFFMLLLLLLLSEWYITKNEKLLYALFCVGALSLMVHYVTIGVVLPVFVSVLFVEKKSLFTPKRLASLAVSFLLGLLPILIFPFAAMHASLINWDNPSNLHNLLQLLLRSDYGVVGIGEDRGGIDLLITFTYYFQNLLGSFSLFGLILAGISIIRKQFSFLEIVIFLCFLLIGPVYVMYAHISPLSLYPDVALNHKRLMGHVYIFSYAFVALFLGMGVQRLLQIVKDKKNLFYAAIGWVMVLFLYNLVVNFGMVEEANNKVFYEYGENIVKNITRPTLFIIGDENGNVFNYLYGVEHQNAKNIRLISFAFLQKSEYVAALKQRYPDIDIPFSSIKVGQALDDFYAKNAEKFAIVFVPLTDMERQSISDKFTLLPIGLTVRLIPKEKTLDTKKYIQENYHRDGALLGKKDFVGKTYNDLATNEILMSYALSYTNIGLTMAKLGEASDALYFLHQAENIQPNFYNSFLTEASIFSAKKQYDGAISSYQQMLKFNPTNPQALRGLLITYYQKGNVQMSLLYAQQYATYANTPQSQNEAQAILQALQTGESLEIH